jgi:hypothetical protein
MSNRRHVDAKKAPRSYQAVSHLTAFSDNAGGQNKRRFIVKFWLSFVRNTNIPIVDHNFLISGRSFTERDPTTSELKDVNNSNNDVP